MSLSIALVSKIAAGVVIAGGAGYFGFVQMTGNCPFSCDSGETAAITATSSSEGDSCCPLSKSAGLEVVDVAMPAEGASCTGCPSMSAELVAAESCEKTCAEVCTEPCAEDKAACETECSGCPAMKAGEVANEAAEHAEGEELASAGN